MTRLACIDIGTVTARLAVADVEGGRVLRLAKHSEICNLGQGVDATGRLDEEAMGRVLACVRGYVDSAREAGAVAACCTLTSAARDAENAAVLGAELDALGLDPLIIPGRVEGALTFLGVTRDFCGQDVLVADNGGGSTELACGCAPENASLDLRFVRSVDVGCRRVTEKFLSSAGPDDAASIARAHEFAAAAFAPAVREGGLAAAGAEGARAGAPATLVVTGGTVTSLVAVRKGLVPYDPAQVHLATLTREELEGLELRLAALTVSERAELPGLAAKRAPVILGGAVAVLELMRQTGFDRLTVSESDLLFGLSIAAESTLVGVESPVGWAPTMRMLR